MKNTRTKARGQQATSQAPTTKKLQENMMEDGGDEENNILANNASTNNAATNNNNNNPTVVVVPEEVQHMLKDIEQRFQKRIDDINDDITDRKNLQQQTHAKFMYRIPKNVKGMTIREFESTYNCDLMSDVIKRVDETAAATGGGGGGDTNNKLQEAVAATAANNAATAHHGRKKTSPELETPAPSRRCKNNGMTPSRTIRKGQAIHSDVENEGVLVATIQKKTNRRGGAGGGGTDDVSLDLNLGQGDYLSLNDPSGIDSDKKDEAIDQLELLKAKVEDALNSLKNG